MGSLDTVNIFPPKSKPYGLSYQQHIDNFWKYMLSIPAAKNPWEDLTGGNCDNGQENLNSSVFYLAGSGGGKVERKCTIPAGKGLFIPVSPMEMSTKEAGEGTSPENLKLAAKKDQDGVTTLFLKIGGKEYNFDDLRSYRTSTDIFKVNFADNGLFGVEEGGPAEVAADGYYVITEPLQKGNYSVQYTSSLSCLDPGCTEPTFSQDVGYALAVE